MEKYIFFTLAYDSQKALQSATQNLTFNFKFSEYRFESVNKTCFSITF